jgi:hypothetical protein
LTYFLWFLSLRAKSISVMMKFVSTSLDLTFSVHTSIDSMSVRSNPKLILEFQFSKK